MAITYTTVTNPKFISEDGTRIELTVKFDHLDAPVPFVAVPDDIEEHGRELYQRAKAGGFGPVAEYVAPVPVTPPAPTKADYTAAVQRHIDDAAKARGYDSMLSATSYIGYPNAYQAEATALATWRSEVWVYCEGVLAAVEAGTAEAPTIEGLIASLPVFTFAG